MHSFAVLALAAASLPSVLAAPSPVVEPPVPAAPAAPVYDFQSRRLLGIPPSSAASYNVTDQPIAPTEDPWYTAPYEFGNEAPGTILRVRPAPGNLSAITGNCSSAWNILYRTTDSRYLPTWAVTTLFVPFANTTTGRNGSLLSYQIPYDSVSLDASPSYALYAGVDVDISESLGKGWFVSVPDYEGPLASFTAGVLSGHATIDSIRAVLRGAARFDLPGNTSYAMWGYSGGALASEWAAELAVQYAPELHFSGAALGGLTPNVTSVLYSVYNSVEAGLVPPAILGISNQFPDVYQYILSRLKTEGPYNKTGFLATKTYSLSQNIATYALQNISEYFEGGLQDIFSPQAQQVIHSDGLMGYHGVPQMPLYVYKAIKDEVSPINDTDALVERFCGVGVNINYDRNTNGGHSAEGTNGRDGAITWLNSIFDGSFATSANATGCFVQNVFVNVSSSQF
ncbi:lipase 1 precursor [Sporothrix brasiliensis 5110]|uniref:Lipase 1 n=1 Tax=Sporothrix brasiliensis 5110 TaxID=1398154 RepID=A0A0C2IXT1_9PEZI|nr:lipase 1 precursor [Sporothrix brasiliensis 5110]KIH89847.1 lipase 1 precursor [Sporothrix brasiliensis 5110]